MANEPDPALVERVADRAWEALKARCCSDPPEAVRCVMVGRADFDHAISVAIAALRAAGWREATEPLPEDVAYASKRIVHVVRESIRNDVEDGVGRIVQALCQRAVEAAEDRLIGLLRAALKDAGSKDAWAELDRTADAWRARTRSAEKEGE